jgi:hypothetical protein
MTLLLRPTSIEVERGHNIIRDSQFDDDRYSFVHFYRVFICKSDSPCMIYPGISR